MIGINRKVRREQICEEETVIVRGRDAELLRNGGIIISREDLETLKSRVILTKTEFDELRYGCIPKNERTKMRTFFDRLDRFLETGKKHEAQPSDPGRVSDESTLLDPGDAGGRVGRTADVDQMVSSFLSELDTFSDAVQSPRGRPAREGHDSAAPTEVPKRRAILKAASYRNIDVLLMDNARSAADRERPREKVPQSSRTIAGDPPVLGLFDNAFLRLAALGWTSLKSVYARCRSVF